MSNDGTIAASLGPAIDFPPIWDMHACLPRNHPADLEELDRYLQIGTSFVCVNIGFDIHPWRDTLYVLADYRRWIRKHQDRFSLVETVADVDRARQSHKMGIAFNIEGGNALDGEIALLEAYYALGVRWMLLAYNRSNNLAGGCLEPDIGLTDFGKQVVAELNRIGMIVDCSHTSERATFEMMDLSSDPVIFSHSNPRKLKEHPRNISDEQIKRCAERGGVVGINGVGRFLGDNDTRSKTIVEHIDYVSQLAGIDSVGLGLDCVFDLAQSNENHRRNPDMFPEGAAWSTNSARFAVPEQIPEIKDLLFERGYSGDDVNKVMGLNFQNLAGRIWK